MDLQLLLNIRHTLELLSIPATRDNLSHLLGIHEALDTLISQAKEADSDVHNNE